MRRYVPLRGRLPGRMTFLPSIKALSSGGPAVAHDRRWTLALAGDVFNFATNGRAVVEGHCDARSVLAETSSLAIRSWQLQTRKAALPKNHLWFYATQVPHSSRSDERLGHQCQGVRACSLG